MYNQQVDQQLSNGHLITYPSAQLMATNNIDKLISCSSNRGIRQHSYVPVEEDQHLHHSKPVTSCYCPPTKLHQLPTVGVGEYIIICSILGKRSTKNSLGLWCNYRNNRKKLSKCRGLMQNGYWYPHHHSSCYKGKIHFILGCTWTSKHPSLSHREAYITVQQCISILPHLGFALWIYRG